RHCATRRTRSRGPRPQSRARTSPPVSSRCSPNSGAGGPVIDRLSTAYGRLLAALALLGCAVLLAMMLIIVVDVALRNRALPGMPRGLAWSNEISELMLYLITMCVAPWLL